MRKEPSICSQLGVTQQDMAMLLGVSRSQWSMFELGKRSLPTSAMVQLAELLNFAKASQVSKSRSQAVQQNAMRQKLSRLLKDNEYRRLLTARKMIVAEKKHAAQTNVLPLIGVLEKGALDQSLSAPKLLGMVGDRASEEQETNTLMALFQLEVKQQLLDLEKELIEAKLKEIADSK